MVELVPSARPKIPKNTHPTSNYGRPNVELVPRQLEEHFMNLHTDESAASTGQAQN